jgi:tetratricopeptide (TPR) repeat protein
VQQAAHCFEKVLAERPDDWRTRHRLATCLRILGKRAAWRAESKRAERHRHILGYDEIGKLLRQSLPALPAPKHILEFAKLYESVGRLEQAKRWYELLLQYDEKNAEAAKALSELKRKLGPTAKREGQ